MSEKELTPEELEHIAAGKRTRSTGSHEAQGTQYGYQQLDPHSTLDVDAEPKDEEPTRFQR